MSELDGRDPMTKAFEERSTWYAATGHQPGGRVNYIAVGSSSKMNRRRLLQSKFL